MEGWSQAAWHSQDVLGSVYSIPSRIYRGGSPNQDTEEEAIASRLVAELVCSCYSGGNFIRSFVIS